MARFQKWTLKALLGVKLVLFLVGMGALLLAQDLAPTQIFEKVKASVVVVKVFNAEGEATSLGSGVKFPSGRIVTNFHVVKGGARFQVGQGDHFVPAAIYAVDAEKDLCLLDAPGLEAPAASMGRTSDLKVGAVVYAVGSPQGLELSLSNGIVSQLRGAKPPIIQTTAAISPGSSGGGLFDGQGRLVGITSWYFEGGQNLNFALPVEWVLDLRASSPPKTPIRSEGEWMAQTIKLLGEDRLPELLTWSQAWAASNASSAEAWSWVGFACDYLKKYAEGIQAHRKELTINPNLWLAWVNLGHNYRELQQYVEAIEAYRQAVKIDANDAAVWFSLGASYQHLESYPDAIEAYRQALRVDSEYADAWFNLGVVYGNLQRYSEATGAYRQSLKINSENVDAWNNIGTVYCQLQRYSEAIEAFRQSLKINPKNAGAWNNLGTAYNDLQRNPEAIEAYLQALKINPQNAQPWCNLGLAYDELKRYPEAIESYRRALKINPKYADAWNNLGIAYLQSGNKSAALESVKQLRRLDPDRADRLFDLIVPR